MSIDENKATVLRYYDEVLNRGALAVLREIAIPQYDEHDPLPGQTNGIEGLMQRVQSEFVTLQIGDHILEEYADIPLFWFRNEVFASPKVVDSWVYPGPAAGRSSHFELIKLVK